MELFTFTRPDDWHLHLRDEAALAAVLPDTARRFGRAIIMPNLRPPITSVEQALAYRNRILAALPEGASFQPLMTLYLTDNTSSETVREAKETGLIHAAKLYPAGATTNSDSGVTDIAKVFPVLKTMAEVGMPLLIHGEVTDTDVDIFDREAVFIERVLVPLSMALPHLKIVFEHITTEQGVRFVEKSGANIAATITAHHLLMSRNALFQGGIRPHHYCLPVLKREQHRKALLAAATSGNKKFFLGTDSAPHAQHTKEAACGCAGMYTAFSAIELYAEAFASVDKLHRLEGFASFFGADFYGLPRNQTTVTLSKQTWQVPATLPYGDDQLVPFRAGETLEWMLVDA